MLVLLSIKDRSYFKKRSFLLRRPTRVWLPKVAAFFGHTKTCQVYPGIPVVIAGTPVEFTFSTLPIVRDEGAINSAKQWLIGLGLGLQ